MPDEHDDCIEAGDPRYDGYRVRELWMYIAIDPNDDQEGVVCIAPRLTVPGFGTVPPALWGMPMFATDEARVNDLRPIAELQARETGQQIRLVRFTDMTTVETFGEEVANDERPSGDDRA